MLRFLATPPSGAHTWCGCSFLHHLPPLHNARVWLGRPISSVARSPSSHICCPALSTAPAQSSVNASLSVKHAFFHSSTSAPAIWDSFFGKKDKQEDTIETEEIKPEEQDKEDPFLETEEDSKEQPVRTQENGLGALTESEESLEEGEEEDYEDALERVKTLETVEQSAERLHLFQDKHRWAPFLRVPLVDLNSPAEAALDEEEAEIEATYEENTDLYVYLNPNLFLTPIRTDILHRCVLWQLAKKRAGSAKAKGRGEVRGSTRKIFRQKGTGRARAGSIRAHHRVGGGVAHGPVPRNFYYPLQLKVRKMAVRVALAVKYAQGKLRFVAHTDLDSGKTADLALKLQSLGWKNTLLIDEKRSENDWPKSKHRLKVKKNKVHLLKKRPEPHNIHMATRNLAYVKLLSARETNVYDILRYDLLVLTPESAQELDRILLDHEEPHPYEPTHTKEYRDEYLLQEVQESGAGVVQQQQK